MALRAARRDPPFCPEQPEGTTAAPPLLLLTVPVKSPPPGFPPTYFTSHRVSGGRTVAPHAGLCGGARAAVTGRMRTGAPARPTSARRGARRSRLPSPRLKTALTGSPAVLSELRPLKSQRGARCSTSPSSACRAGSLAVSRPLGRGRRWRSHWLERARPSSLGRLRSAPDAD